MWSQIWDGLAQGMAYILDFFYQLTGSYGIAIILLTLVIRLALYPLIHRQNLSTRAMQEIQPEVKKLQEKHKGDPQKLNEEIMKLYREKGVNPLGGCLPLLIQLPFLFVLYRVFASYDYGSESFLWLPTLSQPDPYFILPLAMGFTTFLQQKMAMPASGEGAQQNMLMMVIMPVFLVFISWSLPAGVLLYWFVSNLFYIFQQYMVNLQVQKAKSPSSQEEPGTIAVQASAVDDPPPATVEQSEQRQLPAPNNKEEKGKKKQKGKKGGKKHAKKR